MLGFGRNPIKTLTDASAKYGDVCYISSGGSRFYLLSNPAHIQRMLTVDYRNFTKGAYFQRTRGLLGDGLLTSEGALHHRERRLILPAFHQQMVVSYAKEISESTSKLMGGWRDGETRDLHREMSKLTLSIVAKCLFSLELGESSNEIGELLTRAIDYYDRIAHPLGSIGDRLALPSYRKYREAEAKLNAIAYKIVQGRRKSGEDPGDMLSMLLKAEETDGGGMTDKQVRDETITFLLVGHETTAAALTWAWFLLSRDERAERKLHEEVDRVLPDLREPTSADIPRLEYTNKVFTETLRLYPPVWAFGRSCTDDYEVEEYVIPAHSTVVVSQYLTHRDRRFFPNPNRFDPDRWTPEMKAKLPKFAYFPFGGGPRACLGEPLAWMEGTLILAAVARRWSLRRAKAGKVVLAPRITLRPRDGMRMSLQSRG